MNGLKLRFSLLVGVLCLVFAGDAFAVPSVKYLGAAKTQTGSVGTIPVQSAKTTTTAPKTQRLSSVRTVRSTVKPTSIKQSTAFTGNSTSRLSVGKYLHNAGVDANIIKKVYSPNPMPAGIELEERVLDLESKIDNYYTKQEIDDKNYMTKTDLANDWSAQKPEWAN